jgi:hypothetical protein
LDPEHWGKAQILSPKAKEKGQTTPGYLVIIHAPELDLPVVSS